MGGDEDLHKDAQAAVRPPAARTRAARRLLSTAQTLIEALPFLQKYSGSTLVIKLGGQAMEDDAQADLFARDVALLRQVGLRPIIVHGGAGRINGMLDRLGVASQFVNGLRVTDKETMAVVEMVLAGTINKEVAARLTAAGAPALGLSGRDGGLVTARRKGGAQGEALGLVASPVAVRGQLLSLLQAADVIPVVAPIAADAAGVVYNINADEVATAIASEMRAMRLVMLTDVAGVRGRRGEILPELSPPEARRLIAQGVIAGGMIPKVEMCSAAVEKGVAGAVILSGRRPHALLLEVFTDLGFGTLITASKGAGALESTKGEDRADALPEKP